MTACENGYRGNVDMLLAGGANVNAKKNDGATALMIASTNGHREIVKRFSRGRQCQCKEKRWRNGADDSLHGRPPGDREGASRRGADVNAKQKKGATAYKLAKEEGHKDVAELLRKAEAK